MPNASDFIPSGSIDACDLNKFSEQRWYVENRDCGLRRQLSDHEEPQYALGRVKSRATAS